MDPMEMMEEPMEEPMEEEKPMEMMEPELDDIQKAIKNDGFLCCCCLCQCSPKRLNGLTCCCFFPIKCGVLFIGCIILAITLFVFLEIFYELLNDDIHWWYVLVGIVLASTLIVASAFVIIFFTDDTSTSRLNMMTACILVIVGVSLIAVWSTCYFVFLYKKDSVVTGNDGVGFVKATRKQEVVITLYIACCIDALFAYFICVVSQYIDAMKDPEKAEEDKMEEEDKKDDEEKGDDDKKKEEEEPKKDEEEPEKKAEEEAPAEGGE